MSHDMSIEEFHALLGKRKNFGPAAPAATSKASRSAEPNRGERAYGLELSMQRNDGKVAWFAFQPVTLKLANDCRYTADYLVQYPDGSLELVDVKGRKGAGYWCEEDAKIKIRVAADKFPMFKFVIAWPLKDGGWGREEFS